MSKYQAKIKKISPDLIMLNPRPEHFLQIQELCKKVYPFSKPWSLAQLESHRSYFPDGQLIVIEKSTNKVVGLAFSLIILWNDYSPQDNWQDFTSAGFFHNHNPKVGKTLYGAEVMVDPEYRGLGIGKMLYQGRQQIVKKYNLKRIRAGARLRGYSKFQEKMTPREYVINVINKKIFDPTLSFQINNGFKVIDVAPNYLFNDPESLGFAAVIEWLEPSNNSGKDFEKQKNSIDAFLLNEKISLQHLPKELRKLVRKATTVLGNEILEIEGPKFFSKVEQYRELLKKVKKGSAQQEQLNALFSQLKREDSETLFKIAHAFSLQLELINVCETAYRTWRLKQKAPPQQLKDKLNLTFVLTAHPTEARSKNLVLTLNKIQGLLIEGVRNNFLFDEAALSTDIKLMWLQPLSKTKKPTVMDEAEYIYSLIFDTDVFQYILKEKPGYDLRLRTWVGGDKDGHPGVEHHVMTESLNRSRLHILKILAENIDLIIADLVQLSESTNKYSAKIQTLKSFKDKLNTLNKISHQDGVKIKKWIANYRIFLRSSTGPFVKTHQKIKQINRLIELFPAFVLPLEFREDASMIEEALHTSNSAIRMMLKELAAIAGPLEMTSYVRGLVISHCESEADIANACKLVDVVCKSSILPVIPLFESREALIASKKILKSWMANKKNQDRVYRHWLSKFEIMLGYSDSAKQTGVFSSRLLIARSMDEIEKTLKIFRVKPIFFHGSGGSVARGGGSIKEQISWWSKGAIEAPKMTVQGEMIQRLFATKEILNSHCSSFTIEALRRKTNKAKLFKAIELQTFERHTADAYLKLVNDKKLLTQLLEATPYRYLDVLQIGSRPSKRPSDVVNLGSLRAIPWVLCWTQSRTLLPTWWGVGSAWQKISADERNKMKNLFQQDPFFSSYVKALCFTLSKVELNVWKFYLKTDEQKYVFKNIEQEYKKSVHFALEVSGEKKLLWFRPWLEESIELRSPQIHILNLIQVLAMQKSDESLLRETIVGIASGMLTTG